MKMNKISLSISTALLAAGFMTSSAVNAQGRLVVYCSATNILCETTTKAFGEKYDVKTSFIRNGSGSTFAKVEAEKNNPQADVWFGGTFDPQAQAAELGLIEPYKSKHIDEIVERFRDPAKTKGHYVSAIYMGILGFGVNTERLAKLGIKEVPKCWKDLTDPRLKGEVQIADPQSAGTAYTALATFVQLWGEEKAFDFLKKGSSKVILLAIIIGITGGEIKAGNVEISLPGIAKVIEDIKTIDSTVKKKEIEVEQLEIENFNDKYDIYKKIKNDNIDVDTFQKDLNKIIEAGKELNLGFDKLNNN